MLLSVFLVNDGFANSDVEIRFVVLTVSGPFTPEADNDKAVRLGSSDSVASELVELLALEFVELLALEEGLLEVVELVLLEVVELVLLEVVELGLLDDVVEVVELGLLDGVGATSKSGITTP